VDLDEINRFYGTSIGRADLETLAPPAALRRLVDLVPAPLSLLKSAIILRMSKRLAARWDVVVCANNEADFERRGIQYVHFPWNFRPRPAVDLRWYHRVWGTVSVYYRFCDAVSAFSFERMKANVTLVNSDWTADRVREWHGIGSRTLYPPVTGEFPDVPWEAREPAFLCIGRISPEKEVDRVIDILAAVRAEVPGVRLTIVGTPGERRFYRRIVARARASGGWITLAENVPRTELLRLIARHRYGIHGMPNEHFGMAIAEMVRGGLVVWVPRSGGQMEIVGEPRLMYEGTAEAVASIVATLSDGERERDLRAHLARRAASFAPDRFVREFRAVVAEAAAWRSRP
jgi:glycosyltransferase involved in cell wall biosynthesis